jgi:hypothetical protein
VLTLIIYLTEGLYLAQDSVPTDIINTLLQQGPYAVIAALGIYVGWILWKRNNAAQEAEIKRLTEEIERQRARADRLEAELTARNTDTLQKYVTSLEQAKSVISEAVLMMRIKQQ